MKNFFISFLGTIAGIWASVILFGLLMIFSLVLVAIGGSSSDVSVSKNSILYIDLNTSIVEYRQPRNLLQELQGNSVAQQPLNELVGVIDRAASDKRIEGIFLDCNGADAGLAQRQAIFEALLRFKKNAPEKWIYAYGDAYTQGDYFTACAADSIFVNPSGMIDIHGLSATNLYFKGLLDKLGVKMQVMKVGTYKSAVEPFILDGPSEASIEQQKLFLGNIWNSVAGLMAKRRRVKRDSVESWANTLMMAKDVDWYLKNRVADAKVYRHQFLDKLKALTGRDKLRLVTPSEYASDVDITERFEKPKAKIGIYYASGDIVDTGNEGISAEVMVDDILSIAEDDDLDGLVIRVNSGGGSAFASEQIWEAIEQYKAMTGKPVYVSMSDYAASGGYYISCGADKIFAEPLTLTGSIGIFGLLPDASGLLNDKLGVTTYTVSTNPSGDLPTIFSPMTPSQQLQMQANVNRGYELFVKRVSDGRKIPVDSVKRIAEGRVWDGAEALRRGLVDRLGGLDATLAALAEELNVDAYEVLEYPSVSDKWWEALLEVGSEMEASVVRHRLGEAAAVYETLDKINSMSRVQARMEYLEVRL